MSISELKNNKVTFIKKEDVVVVIVLIFLCAASRLIEHPYNFTPITAMAILAGCFLRKKEGVFIPFMAMLISDYFIGFYDVRLMLSVYLGIAMSYSIASKLNNKLDWRGLFFCTIVSSTLFFIVTNLAVWFFMGWYELSMDGLKNCFVMALPFFKNALLGDIIYSFTLFYSYRTIVLFVRYIDSQFVKVYNL